MKYIKHNYKKNIRPLYTFAIPFSVSCGIVFGILIYLTVSSPDRPIEYVGWAIVFIGVLWATVGFPMLIIWGMERAKKYRIVGYYSVGYGFVDLISPKLYRRKIKFENVILIAYPKVFGSKLENLDKGSLGFICNRKYQGAATGLNMKDSFRILVYYLKWIKKNPDQFKAVIKPSIAEANEWKIEDTIKKALRKSDPGIWEKFLEKWWEGREKGKEYWLKTPIERILKDIHCPYTLEELENPSEDEIVEIDESELKEMNC